MTDADRIAELESQMVRVMARLFPRPRAADLPTTGELLRVIFILMGAAAFTAGEICRLADREDAERLRAALVAAGMVRPKQLGKLLQSLDGFAVDGLTVCRIGHGAAGALWTIRAPG